LKAITVSKSRLLRVLYRKDFTAEEVRFTSKGKTINVA
jgi:hypothetical protein